MLKNPLLIVVCAVLLLFLPFASAESRDNVIFSSNSGECTLSVESNDQWHTLRLRAHHPSGKNCFIGKDLSAPFDAALAKGGYKVRSASVEKVLVGRFRDVPLYRDNTAPGLVPYDAQVWFRLESK
jgi:hypothetical protein